MLMQERHLCVLQVYAPTIESQYELFWRKLKLHGEKQLDQSTLFFWTTSMHMQVSTMQPGKVLWGKLGDPNINMNGKCLFSSVCIINPLFSAQKNS